MNSRAISLFAVCVLFLLAACASDPVTTANGGVIVKELGGPGDFRYVHKGTEFHRFTSSAAAKTYAEQRTTIPRTDHQWIDINLEHPADSAQHLPRIAISLQIYFTGDAAVGTYVLDSVSTKNEAFLTVDSNAFRWFPGGSIVITHYDPVSNLVSGSFAFTAHTDWAQGPPYFYDTISGAFQDVGILLNGNEHGRVTATLNDTTRLSTEDLNWQAFVAAWSDKTQKGYTIQAQLLDSNSRTYPLLIEIPSVGPGTYSFESDGSVPDVWFNFNKAMKGAGTVQITRSDPTTHRFGGS